MFLLTCQRSIHWMQSTDASYRSVAHQNFSNWSPMRPTRIPQTIEDAQVKWGPPDRQISLLDDMVRWTSWRWARPRTFFRPNCLLHHWGYVTYSELWYIGLPVTQYIGEFNLEDKSKPDQIFKLVAGDVLHVDEATDVIWTSPTGGKGN